MSNAVHEWPGTVLALNDLQRLGPNLRELIVADKAVLTPCAHDEIKGWVFLWCVEKLKRNKHRLWL